MRVSCASRSNGSTCKAASSTPSWTAFARRTKALRLGPALDYSADVGSLISQDQLDKITAHIQDAVGKGATVLAGGQARPEIGPYFFEPTILTDVTPEMKLYREETFGPVVAIYRFDDVEDAIRPPMTPSTG